MNSKYNRLLKSMIFPMIFGLIGGLIGFWGMSQINGPNNTTQDTNLQQNNVNHAMLTSSRLNSIPNEDIDFTNAADKTIDAVVHVKTKFQHDNNAFYQFFFGDEYGNIPPVEGTGSGVIISKDGYIVTNNHVIEKSSEIEVILNDKRSFNAKLIGRDPSTDLALLKIEAKDLSVIELGNSDNLKVGEWVLAIGNPFNLTSTVTAGIVSAKARNINILSRRYGAIESFIQTDAAVNPGNSGGALIDVHGKLVGINTAIASKTGSFTGYSFAVPVSIVKKVINDLIEFGTVQRALLGVQIVDINQELADKLNLNNLDGVYVSDVTENGAAKDAGVQKNDIIVQVESKIVNKVSELQEQISKYRPGDKIKIRIKRDKKIKEFIVTLRNESGGLNYKNREVIEMLGASFEEIDNETKSKLNINNGVRVVDLQPGKLLKAGIKDQFIIVSINGEKINTPEDIQYIVNNTRGGVYIEGIYPNGAVAYYAFGLR